MVEMMKKHGLWAVCFTVFITVVLMMTVQSGDDRAAEAQEDKEEGQEEMQEDTEDAAENENDSVENQEATEEDEADGSEDENGEQGTDDGAEESEEGVEAEEQDEEGDREDSAPSAGMNGETVAYQAGMELQTNSVIADAHDYLNKITGWGRLESVVTSELIMTPAWQKLKENQAFMESEGFAVSAAKRDIERAGQLIMIVETEGDKDALLFLHRLLHDLDIHINESEGQHFGVTEAFGGEGEAQGLSLYVNRYAGE
ncbi:hypothetical protein CR205_14100 [Alteribacter lacisalsi]|uniref:Uncharacterized protein n=1 Tax=Alteribacter lacisalsi TaxID=2045244 RepID=A0A2W0HT69_9BACI|nr:hypothetical protein [Alteribacter lacisalsi]PYZ96808.1 hypothetical protein CR205_14100 [Alteribacter lacisalsi]